MFTRSDLKSLATPASYRRGEAYFLNGAVGKLKLGPTVVSATVKGSKKYQVQLLDRDSPTPEFLCNCPYAYEGICKHAVALGLAVLAEQRENGLDADEPAAPEAEQLLRELAAQLARSNARPASAMQPPAPVPGPPPAPARRPGPRSAQEALRTANKAELVRFLESRLAEDEALAAEFVRFIHGPELPADPLEDDPTLPRLAQLRQELNRRLKALHFDADTLRDAYGQAPARNAYYYSYGYNGELLLPATANALLDTVLLPLSEQLLAALRAGRLGEVLRRWHAAWAAFDLTARPAADEFWLFSGASYGYRAGQYWLKQLEQLDFFRLLRQQALEPAEARRCGPLLTRPALTALQPSRQKATALPGPPAAHQQLLEAAAANTTLAPALLELLSPHLKELPPLLRLNLAAGSQDWAAWEPHARRLAATQAAVALELLEFYAADPARRTTLFHVAAGYLTRYPGVVGPFVLRHFTPTDDHALYVQALTQRLHTQREFADFVELTTLWTPEERQQFVTTALQPRTPFPVLFRAQLLAAERRGAEILPLALSLSWAPQTYIPSPPELPELLLMAARFRPEDTLDALMERTEKLLEDKRTRTPALYPCLVTWLQALVEVPVLTEQVQLFADELYRTYIRLAQLRTALREAGLLPEKEPLPPAEPRQPFRRKPQKR